MGFVDVVADFINNLLGISGFLATLMVVGKVAEDNQEPGIVSKVLSATDNDGEYGDLKWHEKHNKGYGMAGPDWYGGKYMGGGNLPDSAVQSDKQLARDQRLASRPDGEDPGVGYPKESGKWRPDGC